MVFAIHPRTRSRDSASSDCTSGASFSRVDVRGAMERRDRERPAFDPEALPRVAGLDLRDLDCLAAATASPSGSEDSRVHTSLMPRARPC